MSRKSRPSRSVQGAPPPLPKGEEVGDCASQAQPSIPPGPGDRPIVRIALVTLLVLTTLFAYRRSLSSDFITLDDPWYVTANTRVQEGLNSGSFAWAWTAFDASNWHPVTWLSHMLDVQLFGLDAGKHHLTNLLLHCANAVLLMILLFRMTGALWRSALVAFLFALHPLHVESVAWIAERKDVLSTLFWLLTLWAWLAYTRSKKPGPYALALALFSLGLMSKPMLVTLPFTLLLLDFWPLGRATLPLRGQGVTVKRLLWEKAPLFAMSAASCVFTLIAQREAMQNLSFLSPAERVANALKAYAGYLDKMVWPSKLAVFYPYHQTGLLTGSAAAALLLLAALTILALKLARRAPYLCMGWLWYLGTLVPVIGLIQVGDQSMADRYTYVPLIGIFIAAAWGLADLTGENRTLRHAAAALAVVVLAGSFAVTRVQTGYWTDAETLFGHALEVTSDNWVAHNCLGISLAFKGRMNEAVLHYAEALRINPRHSDIHNNMALRSLRLLPLAPRRTSRMAGRPGGSAAFGVERRGAPAGPAGPAPPLRLVLVSRHPRPRHRTGPGRGPGHGGPLHLYAAGRPLHRSRLEHRRMGYEEPAGQGRDRRHSGGRTPRSWRLDPYPGQVLVGLQDAVREGANRHDGQLPCP